MAPFRDLLIVLACALGLRLAFALLTADTYDYDEFVILLLGRDYAHGAVPYHDFQFFHPPGVLVLFRQLEPLTSLWWPVGRALTLLVDSATAGLVWYLGGRLYERRVALAAGLLYALSPLALVSAVRVGQDPLITFLGVAGLALLLSGRSHRRAVLAGAFLGVAIWIKYPALVLLPVYVLAAPRRTPSWLAGGVLALALAFAPFAAQWHQLYDATITFQRSRWLMPLDQRLETAALFWLLVNPLALVGLIRHRYPAWLVAGFGVGGIFALTSQVYYHYFVPEVPFAALLGAPVAARLAPRTPRLLVAASLALAGAWAAVIDLGGPSPLYVTAAHLSDINRTIQLLDRTTRPTDRVLADRFEYPYLARRPSLLHYFWNIGLLVDARYLERHVQQAGAVVLSYGASSGYPAGFTQYLDARYHRRVDTAANTVWLTRG